MPNTTTPAVPPDLLPPREESREARFARRMRAIATIRRRRRLAGLTLKQVGLATMMSGDRVARYESGTHFPGPDVTRRLLQAIARLEAEGVGDPARAETARLEYEAEEAVK